MDADELIAELEVAVYDAVKDAAELTQRLGRIFANKPMSGQLDESIVIDGPGPAASLTGWYKSAPRGPAVIAARVGPTTIYGRIRELGGTIYPKYGRYLKWYWEGRPVYKKSSKQHGVHYMLKARDVVQLDVLNIFRRRIGAVLGG